MEPVPSSGWHTVKHVLTEVASDHVVRKVVGAILITGVAYLTAYLLDVEADYQSMWNTLSSTDAILFFSSGLGFTFGATVLSSMLKANSNLKTEIEAQERREREAPRTLYLEGMVSSLCEMRAEVWVTSNQGFFTQLTPKEDTLGRMYIVLPEGERESFTYELRLPRQLAFLKGPELAKYGYQIGNNVVPLLLEEGELSMPIAPPTRGKRLESEPEPETDVSDTEA